MSKGLFWQLFASSVKFLSHSCHLEFLLNWACQLAGTAAKKLRNGAAEVAQYLRACTPLTEAFKKEKEQTHRVVFSVLLCYTNGVTLRGLMTLVPWFQAASEARHHVAVSKSQRTRGTPITWRSNPSCNCEIVPSSKFRDARTMKRLPRKLQDGVQLAQGRGYGTTDGQSWRARLSRQALWTPEDSICNRWQALSLRVGVGFSRFQYCFSSIILCYVLIHPFGRRMFIPYCSI